MLRPVRPSVALHTRGHQIKSLVVSVAHPSVRPRARKKKVRAGERGGDGIHGVSWNACGPFCRKRHRFSASLRVSRSRFSGGFKLTLDCNADESLFLRHLRSKQMTKRYFSARRQICFAVTFSFPMCDLSWILCERASEPK